MLDLLAILPASTREFAHLAAESAHPVLLYGETGSGKTLLAHAIHQLADPGRRGPFVHVNCAAIPESLFEREMFGHVKGAFTDARESCAGMLEAAHGGTLFLDELGELPLTMQPKLLQALEAGAVRRVGATRSVPARFRLITATNRDLDELMRQGGFREDLYFRCAVLETRVVPLRERRGELRGIIHRLLLSHPTPPELTEAVLRRLEGYAWPGNLRELENCLRHAAVYARGNPVELQHLPARIRSALPAGPDGAGPERGGSYVAPMDPHEEARMILAALRAECGNKTRAARRLGMSRATLWIKLQRHGLTGAEHGERRLATV